MRGYELLVLTLGLFIMVLGYSISDHHWNANYQLMNAVESGWPLLLALFSITTALTYNHGRREAERKIFGYHTKRLILRIIMFGLLALSAVIFDFTWTRWIAAWGFTTGVFGVLFDQIRNYYDDAAFFYLGNESGIDKTFKRLPVIYYLIKINWLIGFGIWFNTLY
jgi:hypothetical protein